MLLSVSDDLDNPLFDAAEVLVLVEERLLPRDPRLVLVTLLNLEVLEVRIMDEAMLLLGPKLEPPKELWLLETPLLIDSDSFPLPD